MGVQRGKRRLIDLSIRQQTYGATFCGAAQEETGINQLFIRNLYPDAWADQDAGCHFVPSGNNILASTLTGPPPLTPRSEKTALAGLLRKDWERAVAIMSPTTIITNPIKTIPRNQLL
ncbi:MAG: hypothetical protein K2X60_11335 [Xanthobacteraceae bacterium]|nr:hypothetical protein [Xanthobacteraceae bacterium]